MKKKNYDEIFSKQRDLQDGLDFNDIKENVEVEEKTKVNFIKYLVPIFAFVVLISTLTVGLIYLNNKQDFINTEYKEAISFFEDNQLDYSELTRSEVIDVHKDVVTNSFKLKVTSYVIKKAVEKTIKISDEIDDPDSDTTRDYWEYFIELHKKKKEKSGDYYDFLSIHENTEKGTMIFTGVVFTKYNNDETIWSIKFDYWALSYVEVDGYILVYGSSLEFPNDTGFISKVTSNGEVLWTSSIDETKGISLIKEIDNKYLGLSTFNGSILKMFYITYDGEINLFNTVDFTPRRITKITEVENNYMLQFNDYSYGINGKTTYEELLIKIDELGNIIKEYTYSDDTYEYKILASCEYKDEMYFAGYRYEKYDSAYERGEISAVLEPIFEKSSNGEEITDDYVLELVKNNYQAVLLKYDKGLDGLTIIEVVEEARSQDIFVEDGKLVWQLASFVWACYSPATSSFTIGGLCDIYNYVLENGEYNIVKTDETVIYRT